MADILTYQAGQGLGEKRKSMLNKKLKTTLNKIIQWGDTLRVELQQNKTGYIFFPIVGQIWNGVRLMILLGRFYIC